MCCFLSATFLGLFCNADEPLQYNRDIRPILADHCFACHGADSAARKADLRLDQREVAIEFGAIEPGSTAASELIARILTEDAELVMPPPETKKYLTARQKEILQQWIAAGAEYQKHWAFLAPQRSAPPEVRNVPWSKNAIDRFVLAELERRDLHPAAEADPRTLFRRLSLDTTGLPPSPADAVQFERDYRELGDVALESWLTRLMDSPAWGEHRGRYWLDAARYADTHGMHFDNYREMWPYRDWVIRAFNANVPFDQFTVQQLAGDLLEDPTPEQLIATGFQRCNMTTNEGGTIDEENVALYASDRVQTLGWVYLGLTTNCCQCHDHKFDPLTAKDYYALAAFFRNTTQQPKDGNVKDGRGPVLVVASAEDLPRWTALPEEIASAVKQREQRKQDAGPAFQEWLSSATSDSFADQIPTKDLVANLPLNEGTGNKVANLVDRQQIETAGNLTWMADGKLGAAPIIKQDATFDLGETADFELDQKFSFGAWVRVNKEGSAAIIAKLDEGASHRGWDLWQQGRSLAVHLSDHWPDNALKVITKKAVLETGKWQHVFATYDGSGKASGVKIFVDGKKQPVKAESETLKEYATIRTSTHLQIGQRSSGSVLDGAVQDVRVYARAVSAVEIQQIIDLVPMQTLMAVSAQERSEAQQAALLQYYLDQHDSQFAELAKSAFELESEREAIRSRSPVTHIQEERQDSMALANILMRGEYDRPGEQVMADTPAALHALPDGAPRNRLGLAQWITARDNPLTARVVVNRFWQQLFGRGLVETSEDFGVMGGLPSHPELLDWLAVEFMESGWDVKHLFKLMLTSATYRQAAVTTPEKLERDRDNVLLSRGPRYRMDAEMVRDYALATSGLLAPKMFGPGVKPYQPEDIWEIVGLPTSDTRKYVQDSGESLYRRTLYSFWKRMAPPPNLEAFNAPSREVCTVRRERTNTPLQALVTLNDPQFVEAARSLAQQALKAGGDESSKIIEQLAQHVLLRELTTTEKTLLLDDFQQFITYYLAHPQEAKSLLGVGESPRDETLDPSQLAAWTMVSNELLNLDETLNK